MERIETMENSVVTDTELGNATWVCDESDVLSDIKFFMRQYYVGFYTQNGNGIIIKFNNGQKFCVSVNEIKD